MSEGSNSEMDSSNEEELNDDEIKVRRSRIKFYSGLPCTMRMVSTEGQLDVGVVNSTEGDPQADLPDSTEIKLEYITHPVFNVRGEIIGFFGMSTKLVLVQASLPEPGEINNDEPRQVLPRRHVYVEGAVAFKRYPQMVMNYLYTCRMPRQAYNNLYLNEFGRGPPEQPGNQYF